MLVWVDCGVCGAGTTTGAVYVTATESGVAVCGNTRVPSPVREPYLTQCAVSGRLWTARPAQLTYLSVHVDQFKGSAVCGPVDAAGRVIVITTADGFCDSLKPSQFVKGN